YLPAEARVARRWGETLRVNAWVQQADLVRGEVPFVEQDAACAATVGDDAPGPSENAPHHPDQLTAGRSPRHVLAGDVDDVWRSGPEVEQVGEEAFGQTAAAVDRPHVLGDDQLAESAEESEVARQPPPAAEAPGRHLQGQPDNVQIVRMIKLGL